MRFEALGDNAMEWVVWSFWLPGLKQQGQKQKKLLFIFFASKLLKTKCQNIEDGNSFRLLGDIYMVLYVPN